MSVFLILQNEGLDWLSVVLSIGMLDMEKNLVNSIDQTRGLN